MLIGTWSRNVARVFEVKEEGDARGISQRNDDLKGLTQVSAANLQEPLP